MCAYNKIINICESRARTTNNVTKLWGTIICLESMQFVQTFALFARNEIIRNCVLTYRQGASWRNVNSLNFILR